MSEATINSEAEVESPVSDTPVSDTEAKPITDNTSVLAKLEAAVSEAREALDKEQAAAAPKIQAITSVVPLDFKALAAASEPVERAQSTFDRRNGEYLAAKATDAWESLASTRQPILDAIDEYIVKSIPTVAVTSVTGSLTITDGVAEVTLRGVLGSLDLSDVAELIASAADVEALTAAGVTALDIAVTSIGEPNALKDITLPKAGAVKVAKGSTGASSGTGTRSGDLEYEYKGQWLGTKAFLTAVEAAGEQIATDRVKGFERALRGDGNAMSNLGKQVAAKLGVASREKGK